MAKRKLVPRTRNAGTWTESQFYGALRSHLRRGFRFWKPIMQAKEAAKRPAVGKGRLKWEYQCALCESWFKGLEDLPGFVERLTAETGYRVLCKPCHQGVTNEERKR